MKKNISINISGIIFHIEEDGYNHLKAYLESINRYFSTYEDSTEIISDIEGRIAEIFLVKLTDGKQVITSEDVDALVKTMGSVSDFEVIEEQEDTIPRSAEEPRSSKTKYTSEQEEPRTERIGSKKLYRDLRRKLIGGVASGVANYFNIDPLWIRLLFVIILFFGAIPFGIFVLAYTIMWVVLPGSAALEDDHKVKKMYRNSEERVLGGVASGVAAYFGTDTTVIRLLFVLAIFLGGAGLFLYVILWIITPEAKTITEKMQMQGEPVTLSGIETNIKQGLNVKEDEKESTLVKILLFPFRLISTFFTALGKALGPIMSFIVQLIRVLVGLVFTGWGLSSMIALVIAGVLASGFLAGSLDTALIDFPLELIRQSVPLLPTIALFFALVLPALVITILGISIIAKKFLLKPMVGWIILVVWIVNVVILSFSLPLEIAKFSREGTHKVEQTFDVNGKTALLKINDIGMDDYDVVSLQLRPTSDSVISLTQHFNANGINRSEAIDNAQMIDYAVVQQDSIITFDYGVTFKPDALFRFQELDMTLNIPYLQPFQVDEALGHLLSYHLRYQDWNNQTYVFTEEDDLVCLTCPNEDEDYYDGFDDNEEEFQSFNIEGIHQIQVNSLFDLEIKRGDEYSCQVFGREDMLQNIVVDVYDGELDLDVENRDYNDDRMRVLITLPEVNKIEANGNAKINVRGLKQDMLEIETNGSSKMVLDIEVQSLKVESSGASRVELTGMGEEIHLSVFGMSRVDAYDYEVERAYVDASAAGTAKVNASDTIEIEKHGKGRVKTRGEGKISYK